MPGEEIPPNPPAEAEAPALAVPEATKAFDPDRCTLEELHRHTTIHSPFVA